MNRIIRISYAGGYMKRNREIKVIVEGTITDDLKKDFNNRLAIALIAQYGVVGAKQILVGLKKEG